MSTISSSMETLDRRDASARPGCLVALVGMGADTVTLNRQSPTPARSAARPEG